MFFFLKNPSYFPEISRTYRYYFLEKVKEPLKKKKGVIEINYAA